MLFRHFLARHSQSHSQREGVSMKKRFEIEWEKLQLTIKDILRGKIWRKVYEEMS